VSCVAGLSLEGNPADREVVARQQVSVDAIAMAQRASLSAVRFSFELPEGWSITEDPERAPDLSARRIARSYLLRIGDDAIPTLPRAVAQYRSLELHQSICLSLRCLLDGFPFAFRVPVVLDVAPRQELALSPGVIHLDPSTAAKGFTVKFAVTNRMPVKTAGKVWLAAPKGWKSDVGTYVIPQEDSGAIGTIQVRPPENVPQGDYSLQFRTDWASAVLPVRIFSVRAPAGLFVGVVSSYDSTLERALQELGVRHSLLTDDELERGDLRKWHTILIDIRAYLVRDGLRRANGRLLEYVRNGGHLVVMYQREQEWKPEYAPLPFDLSRRRITREDAPVDVLDSSHVLLKRPNVITPGDWLDWKQERAVYMPAHVPAGYTRLISSHDPDEPELDTGYLFLRWGKGSYIYTSFVWYRQLKELHPGASRCFANMISYPLVKGE
jgi:hypothetical protein